MTATFHVGDAIQVMDRLPERSVDLILSSPPFLALRSYLPADHPDKALEGGSQATPGAYIDWLVDVVEACARILAPHGSLCFELGDTYSGKSGWGDELGNERYPNGRGVAESRPDSSGPGWPLAKSLSLIPELFRLTLVYGINPLTGRQTERWRLRNVIRWVRPTPPVGALGDKFRPATSELMVFCKSAKRFFDLDAVRSDTPGTTESEFGDPKRQAERDAGVGGNGWLMDRTFHQRGGAPPLDWWNIPPGGYEGAHYAVWPPELLIKPIKAMSPEKVCRQCGEPSRRIVEAERDTTLRPRPSTHDLTAKLGGSRLVASHGETSYETVGWTDCQCTRICLHCGGTGCEMARDHGKAHVEGLCSDCEQCTDGRVPNPDWRPGLVLDPFVGSGTTLAVATGHGRDAIGIDLDERNYALALDRVGPLILQRGEVAA